MKAVKIVLVMLLVYIGIVVAFESLLGYFQPSGGGTLVISTSADGQVHDRVVSRLELDGQLYVAANHWPRAWYRRALENPRVEVTLDGVASPYVATPVTGEEYDRVDTAHDLGVTFRILTGFPPRRLIRLDPR